MKWISSCRAMQIELMEVGFNQCAEGTLYYSLLLSFVFGSEWLRMGYLVPIVMSIKCTDHPNLMLCLRGKHSSYSNAHLLCQILLSII